MSQARPLALLTPSTRLKLWVTAGDGLQALAADELRALGLQAAARQGGLVLDVPAPRLTSILQNLRTCEVALVQLGEAPGRSEAELARLAAFLRDNWLETESNVAVKAHVAGASADRTRWIEATLQALVPAGSGSPQAVHLRCHPTTVDVALDAFGGQLHLRGYRLEPGHAPLRETVAAALLQWAGHVAGMPFWDPLCGSGTLCIEAALAGKPLPRVAACLGWRNLPPQSTSPSADVTPAWGGDVDPQVVECARRNAQRADVSVGLHCRELAQWPAQLPQHGLVASNLPWGVRLGQRADARRLAGRWAAVLRRTVPGWLAGAVVAEPQLAEVLGLDGTEVLKARNGGRAIWLVRGRVRPRPSADEVDS